MSPAGCALVGGRNNNGWQARESLATAGRNASQRSDGCSGRVAKQPTVIPSSTEFDPAEAYVVWPSSTGCEQVDGETKNGVGWECASCGHPASTVALSSGRKARLSNFTIPRCVCPVPSPSRMFLNPSVTTAPCVPPRMDTVQTHASWHASRESGFAPSHHAHSCATQ